ncbi:relaxase/mobilization nuclease domain-containing protein [Pseudoflavonifractor capillosus]|uniref:relaxase/mobilization nuclease domain-containing protein n=1 Tax=Pseudoflavonifractor capillosus TaxID=106588 RepID=UPI001959814B|nr:relaxase/mobilization nuclease domain-containing protein [Pseudoflavonifractor capillosus]MBM6681755.1 relaxase/mobilization nuclease domain-containing protein [Pseudoflavonifractor capillosus]
MVTFTAVKNRGGGRGALGGVLRYTQQDEKTLWKGQRLVTGWNCTAQSALSEMRLTKDRFRKTDGRQCYHFVQSFAEIDDLTPQEAHAIALELAQREFPNFEVLVATHIDTDHLHSHLIVNSVSFQDGRKLHQSAADLQAHQLASDEICATHGLELLPPPQRQIKQKRMGSREYRSAAKGESWKFRLMDTIDQCMKYAETKDEFISLMESEGYQVRWTDSRKNITYTTPEGMKCRDDRLHETKYTKEVMEREFRIRAEIISGGVETAKSGIGLFRASRAAGHSHEAGQGESAGDTHGPVPAGEHQQQPAGAPGGQRCGTGGPVSGVEPAGGAAPAGGAGAGCDPNEGGAETGWEEERAFCFSAQFGDGTVRPDLAGPDFAGHAGGHGGLADDLVRLGRTLERGADADPVRDATTTHRHSDKKALRKEREKKIAMGHKEDDHEEEQTWQQTMG